MRRAINGTERVNRQNPRIVRSSASERVGDSMKGYKAFDENLCCRGMQYEVGKTYEMTEKPKVCARGFHFCQNVQDVFNYYPRNGSRICEVEAIGDIETNGDKSATNKLTVIREIVGIDYSKLIYGDGSGYGYGDGDGSGYGYGDGSGYGYGDGDGSGYGYGYGDGSGYGYGYGDGDGSGYCYGSNIQKILSWEEN